MDTNSLLEHLDGWVLNCLEEELSNDQAWQKLAAVAKSSKGTPLYSISDICQLKASHSPSSAVVQRLIKHGITLRGLLLLLSAAQLSHLHCLLSPKEKAIIVTQPSSTLLEASLGQSVTISIEVKGNPPPSLLWYKGELPLLHHTKNNLEIQHFGAQDEGIYLCLVRQPALDNDSDTSDDDSTDNIDCKIGVQLWSKPVEVYIKEIAPEFSLQPEGCDAKGGDQIYLKVECSATYPPPRFSWYKNKQLITITDDNTFTISDADASSSGEYVCVAINPVGVCTSKTAVVNVQNQNIPSMSTLQITRQPQLNSSFVNRGTPLQLWCSVRSLMPVTFNWYMCGHLLSPSDSNIIIQSEDNDVHNCSLLYVPAEEDPSTLRFLCVVNNEGSCVTSKEVLASLSNAIKGVDENCTYNAHRKWALLVGNTRYGGKSLNTTISDCQRLSDKLTEMGYKCLVLADLTLSHFRNAITFLASFVRQGDYVMFYYGGHGYHEGGDKIIPVDANLGEQGLEGGGDASCLSPVFLRNTLLKSQPALLFIVLDMCRTTLPSETSSYQPSASILPDAARCSVVLHATSIHCAALEAPSSTSVLTRHLLRRLQTHSSEPLTLLAAKVLQDVCGETQKVRQQQYPLLEADLALPRTLNDASTSVTDYVERNWLNALSLGGGISASVDLGSKSIKISTSCEFLEKKVHNIVILTIKLITDDMMVTAKFKVSALGCRVFLIKSSASNERSYKIEDLQCLAAPMLVSAIVSEGSDKSREVSLNLQYPGIAKANMQINNLESIPNHSYFQNDKPNVF